MLAKSCIHCTILLDTFEVQTVYKVELLQAVQWLEVLQRLVNLAFKSIRPDDNY